MVGFDFTPLLGVFLFLAPFSTLFKSASSRAEWAPSKFSSYLRPSVPICEPIVFFLVRKREQINTDKREFPTAPDSLRVDLNSLTEAIIGAAFEVSNTLGAGFLEKLYERALHSELTLRGISVQSQVAYPVAYKGLIIGEYQPDLVVENVLIVELKCVDRFTPTHLAQCLSYLHASGLTLALLLNFQHPKVQCRRVAR